MQKHYKKDDLAIFLKNKHSYSYSEVAIVKDHLDNCRQCWDIWNRVRWDNAIEKQGVQELKEYLGEEYVEYFDSSWALAEEWKSKKRDTEEEVEAFYKETKGYVYNSTIFHESGDRENLVYDLEEIVKEHQVTSVLDYGSGVGNDSLVFLEKGITTFFADFNSPVTDFLKFRIAKRGFTNLSQYVDVQKDERPDVDMIWTVDTLEHMTDPYQIFNYITGKTRVFTYFIDDDTEAGGRHPFHIKFDYNEFNARLLEKGFHQIKSKKLSSWSKVWSR